MILPKAHLLGSLPVFRVTYGNIVMYAAAAVSDVARNDFLSRGSMNKQINRTTNSTKKQQKAKKCGLYHGLPKELQITLLMMCMEDSPATRKSNNDNLSNHDHDGPKRKSLQN